MAAFLNAVEVVVSVLLCICVLSQQRASGLSQSMGGSGVTYVQRRGAEKVLYQGTVVLGVIFFTIPVLQWFVS